MKIPFLASALRALPGKHSTLGVAMLDTEGRETKNNHTTKTCLFYFAFNVYFSMFSVRF